MRPFLYVSLMALAACGGADSDNGVTNPPPVPKKPDPYVTIRVRDLFDTTTAIGGTHWHMYALLTGPYDAQNGVSNQGAISLSDVRLGHGIACIKVGADSVGQRLITTLAIGDTTVRGLTPDAQADAVAASWYAGNHSLPAGYATLSITPTDAWQSAQYDAGHGLTKLDPIKWGWDWKADGTTAFYERTDSDADCANF